MGMQGFAIGGMAEQDISAFIGAGKTSEELRKGNSAATDSVNKGYYSAAGYQQPIYDTGMGAYRTLADNINRGRYNMKTPVFENNQEAPQYQEQSFNFQADPGYQFRLQQGQDSVQASAAARGMGLSGATLKALAKYGQGAASDEYQNAYSRYNNDRNFGYGQYRDANSDYQNNRDFRYKSFSDRYNRDYQQNQDSYNRLANLSQTGINAGNNLSGMSERRGLTLADLAVQRGNINAGEWQGYTDAAYQQGAHLQQIGGMSEGGGGGGMGGFSQMMGGGGGSAGGGGMESGMAMEGGYA